MCWVLGAACLSPQAHQCGDLLCPASLACAPDNTCVLPSQLIDCVGKPDHDPCSVAGLPGVCLGGLCVKPFCGDGEIAAPEQCEGNDHGGKQCTDVGFYGGHLGCDVTSCRFDTSGCVGFCGDNVINGPEFCDGAPSRSQTCVAFGYDSGYLDCTRTICTPRLDDCRFLGWRPSTSSVAEGAIWAAAANDVFAAGDAISHFDGTDWTRMNSPGNGSVGYVAIHGRAGNDVYTVGAFGEVQHYDGVTWSTVVTPASGSSVWAGPSAVYLAGTHGLWRLDRAGWTQVTLPTNEALHAVWGSGDDDVFVGGDAVMLHWDGASWSTMASSVGPGLFVASLWGAGPRDVYAVADQSPIRSDVQVLHYDGASWSTIKHLGGAGGRVQVFGTATNEIYVLSGQEIDFYDGVRWTPLLTSASTLGAIGGVSTTDLHVVGNRRRYRFGGAVINQPTQTFAPLGFWGPSVDDLWACGGNGAMGRWDGSGFVRDPNAGTGANLRALWSDGGGTFYAVGDGGAIRQHAGSSYFDETPNPTTVDLHAIFGASINDMFAVGDGGVTVHAILGGWSVVLASRNVNLRGVWASGPNDYVAVGDGGAIEHFDGVAWSPVASPTTADLYAIWAAGPDDLFATGPNVTLRRQGGVWTQVTDLGGLSLSGTSASDVFIGDRDQFVRFDGAHWFPVRAPVIGDEVAVWASTRQLFVAGTGALSWIVRTTASRP